MTAAKLAKLAKLAELAAKIRIAVVRRWFDVSPVSSACEPT